MSEDATLDDFFENADESEASSGESGEDEDRSEEEPAGDELEGGRSGADSVEPFELTVRWTPRGAPCADCGETVERRWGQEVDGNGGGDGEWVFVCRDCKRW